MPPDIPDFLAHLDVDPRWGLPRPFTTGDRALGNEDPRLRLQCAMQGLCAVCGRPLGERAVFLGGLGMAHDRVVGDGPMHEPCATAALELCPHLARPGSADADAAFWIMLELFTDEYGFQTADEARITNPDGWHGLWEPDEAAGVWSEPGVVVDCAETIVRWRVRDGLFPDAVRFFIYVNRGITQATAEEFLEWTGGFNELLTEIIHDH